MKNCLLFKENQGYVAHFLFSLFGELREDRNLSKPSKKPSK